MVRHFCRSQRPCYGSPQLSACAVVVETTPAFAQRTPCHLVGSLLYVPPSCSPQQLPAHTDRRHSNGWLITPSQQSKQISSAGWVRLGAVRRCQWHQSHARHQSYAGLTRVPCDACQVGSASAGIIMRNQSSQGHIARLIAGRVVLCCELQ